MLTLAAEPEVVRRCGQRCPVVALHFLPLSLHAPGGGQSGGARISRRPAVVPRARLSAGQSGVVSHSEARAPLALGTRARLAQAQRPELAPRLRAS